MLAVWALVFVLVWNFLRPSTTGFLTNPSAEPRSVTARGDLAADEKSTIEVFQEASPSVVQVTNLAAGRSYLSFDVTEIPQGAGSGFVYDRDGYIVTNFHVIYQADAIEVTLADQSSYEAQVVGVAPDKDIAVLRISAPGEKLKPLPIGKSSDLLVGQKVFAIGNPFGYDLTLTTGVVSATGRQIRSMTGRRINDVIQTDAAINPGNSGGPLLDSAGRVIGVNTQIASPSGASAGIGFAVPIDIVNTTVAELIRHGKVTRPGLGVLTLPDARARALGIRGVLLLEVTEGSAAARAGLRGTTVTNSGRVRALGDVLVRVGDQKIASQTDLLDALDRYKVGDEIEIEFVRDDRPATTKLTLQAIE